MEIRTKKIRTYSGDDYEFIECIDCGLMINIRLVSRKETLDIFNSHITRCNYYTISLYENTNNKD